MATEVNIMVGSAKANVNAVHEMRTIQESVGVKQVTELQSLEEIALSAVFLLGGLQNGFLVLDPFDWNTPLSHGSPGLGFLHQN